MARSKKLTLPKQLDLFVNMFVRHSLTPLSGEERLRFIEIVKVNFGSKMMNLTNIILLIRPPSSDSPVVHQTNILTGEGARVNQNSGNTNSQTAGGHITGANAGGNQSIADLTIYSQNLEQSGVNLSPEIRNTFTDTRREMLRAGIDPDLLANLLARFDELTQAATENGAKTPKAAGLWTMIRSVLGGLKDAAGAVEALDKLKRLLGM